MSNDGTKIIVGESGSNGTPDYGKTYTSVDSGLSWTQCAAASTISWAFVVSSADGTKFLAESNGYVYVSMDSGVTWKHRGPTVAWQSLAISADGTHLVGVAGYSGGSDYIYTSSGPTP